MLNVIEEEAFRGCLALPSIQFPPYLQKIGEEAFRSCTTLYEVVIPASVTEIASKPFTKCQSLTRIVCLAPVPPTLKGTDNKDIPLYVPAASVSAYKKAKGWKKFKKVYGM
jgi:hypothetical protein